MSESQKDVLVRYLQEGRDAMLWKLDGASDYDVRRPVTGTGTNLLGLVKHLAYVELTYFVETFGRPLPVPTPWEEDPDVDPHADLVATTEESRDDIVGLYRLAWSEAARSFDALDLEDEGRVPHWPEERSTVTLQQMLVHMIAETHRHAGHADIVRETIDGAVGLRTTSPNIPPDYDWEAHLARVEATARAFGQGRSTG